VEWAKEWDAAEAHPAGQEDGELLKVIASTGGKGGVGKSTFAILLAHKLANEGNKVVLCDCDVECPNDHLLLGTELGERQEILQDFPELVEEKCIKCGTCFRVCRENAIFWVEGKTPQFIEDLCIGCGACEIACPAKAIVGSKKTTGESFVSKVSDGFWLVTGISKVGISETGPVVGAVKERAVKLAEDKGADYLLVDTAPGTHCSVVAALLGCEKVYAVTEPTPLGEYDLRLILDLAKRLKIPAEVVLNKADVGPKEKTDEIAGAAGSRIGFEIPYSEELVSAYCNKELEKVVGLLCEL